MKTPIFYYHSVGGPPPQSLALDQFRAHLEQIRRAGCRTLTVSDLLDGHCRAKNSVVLAFDDGLLDNYTLAAPLLQEFGFRATFYVVPGYDGATRWVHPGTGRWSDTPRPGFTIPFLSMGRVERRELLRAGMEIGSHSLTHRTLTELSAQDLAREIQGSKDTLEQELGEAVRTFCYPRGRFTPRAVQIIRQAGYAGACTTIPGYCRPWSYRFLLPRFLVESSDYFSAVVKGRAFRPSGLRRLAACVGRPGRLP